MHRSRLLVRLGFLVTLLAGTLPAPSAAVPESFAHPRPGRVFAFPRDHGSHPEFRLEWWYVTGHLWNAASNRFGFQSTFFRTAGPRTALPLPAPQATGAFGLDQLFLAHAACLEADTGAFHHRERLHREGWAAGSSLATLHVWNEGASLALLPDPSSTGSPAASPPTKLRLVDAIRGELSWDLTLTAAKPLVFFGTNGVSRKGASPTAASHYLTFSRLQAEGRLTVGETTHAVHGIAWMDHEFGSSQLAEDQTGWDWVAIQLHDGRELMAYRLRRRDGSTDPYSTLAWVDRTGQVTQFSASEFRLESTARWRSPRSGAEYPHGLRLRVPDPRGGAAAEFELVPLAKDQELPGTLGDVPYWEGACRVRDAAGGEVGVGFVELTGYAGNLSGTLR